MPGNATSRRTSFLRLSLRRTCTTSCRSAFQFPFGQHKLRCPRQPHAGPQNARCGKRRSSAEIRSTETEFMESIGLGVNHARLRSTTAQPFAKPAPKPTPPSTFPPASPPSRTSPAPQAPRPWVHPRRGVRAAGTKARPAARVTPAATANGVMRRAKSKSAQRLAEYRWPASQHPPPHAANRQRQGASRE